MKRTILALALCLALTLTPALAAGVEEKFPAINTYPGYADVPAGIWYEAGTKLCYETGLMTGSDKGFEPGRNMQVSEVASIAARIHDILNGGTGKLPTSDPWYQSALDALSKVGVTNIGNPDGTATRSGFLTMLAAVLPGDLLAPINAITKLPDTADATVLQFYNAGILAGIDKYGTFTGDKPLTRMEGATMVAHVVRPSLRVTVTLADYTPFAAAGVAPGTVFFQSEGIAVTAETYLAAALPAIQALERACKAQGIPFNWFNTETATGLTFLEYVKGNTLSAVGVTKAMGTDAYTNFSLQVFYSRYLDLTGLTA